ncbi:MAG: PP2C family protein-serine/threonine phosphatase [Acidobacteriota bacterium]
MVKRKEKKGNIFSGKGIDFLKDELENLNEIVGAIKPSSGEIPDLDKIEIFGGSVPLNGIAGGDHIIYIDFNKRYDLDLRINDAKENGDLQIAEKLCSLKNKAGILIADVSGHKITDASMAAMLHQAFMVGILYELKIFGEVTSELFEILNSRFYKSSAFSKFITMIYGEICIDGTFRFINAGHPSPVVFSNKFNKLMKVCTQKSSAFPPVGTLPSVVDLDSSRNKSRLGFKKRYSVNKIHLMGEGDILILFTDGLMEHGIEDDILYFENELEKTVRSVKDLSAGEIYSSILEDLHKYAEPSDDISFVVIKKG